MVSRKKNKGKARRRAARAAAASKAKEEVEARQTAEDEGTTLVESPRLKGEELDDLIEKEPCLSLSLPQEKMTSSVSRKEEDDLAAAAFEGRVARNNFLSDDFGEFIFQSDFLCCILPTSYIPSARLVPRHWWIGAAHVVI